MSASYRFTHTQNSSWYFPYSVTKASDILVGILHRNKTSKIIGERTIGPSRRTGYFLPVSCEVMAHILGIDIAYSFLKAMQNPTIHEYFLAVTGRCLGVGVNISWSGECWYLAKVVSGNECVLDPESTYTMNDFTTEAPVSHWNHAQG